MGEMTFAFRLVQRLKSIGISCIASTTERITEQVGDTKNLVWVCAVSSVLVLTFPSKLQRTLFHLVVLWPKFLLVPNMRLILLPIEMIVKAEKRLIESEKSFQQNENNDFWKMIELNLILLSHFLNMNNHFFVNGEVREFQDLFQIRVASQKARY
jgi:hypothetical protein